MTTRHPTHARRWHKHKGRAPARCCNLCAGDGLATPFALRHTDAPTCDTQIHLRELSSAIFKVHIRGLPPDATEAQVTKWCLDTIRASNESVVLSSNVNGVAVVEKLYEASPNELFKKADVKLADVALRDHLIRSQGLLGVSTGHAHRVSLCTISFPAQTY